MKEIDLEKLELLAAEIRQYTEEEHRQFLHKEKVAGCPLC